MRNKNIKKMVLTALFFALALVLAFVETMIPLNFGVPGVKLGLANIMVMLAIFLIDKRSGLMIAILKGLYVFMIRGLISGTLSLTGGILSYLIIVLLLHFMEDKPSYIILSISGAILFNFGQMLAISFFYGTISMIYYLPVLLVSAIITGSITAMLVGLIHQRINITI
ncbi:MAG: Gx transporter family protein [Erysipelotrichaceae bacterium]